MTQNLAIWDRKTVPACTFPRIALLEGCELSAHWDSISEQYDIGFGSLHMPNGAKVKQGDTITQAEANAMFSTQLMEWVGEIVALINSKTALNEDQAFALISFVHNEGSGALHGTVFADMLNANDPDAWNQLGGWVIGGGKIQVGLMHRREFERRCAVGDDSDEAKMYKEVFAMTQTQLMLPYNLAFEQAAAFQKNSAFRGPVAAPVVISASPTGTLAKAVSAVAPARSPVLPATTAKAQPPTVISPKVIGVSKVAKPFKAVPIHMETAADKLNAQSLANGPVETTT